MRGACFKTLFPRVLSRSKFSPDIHGITAQIWWAFLSLLQIPPFCFFIVIWNGLFLLVFIETSHIPPLLLKRVEMRGGGRQRERENITWPLQKGFRRFYISAFFSFTMHSPLYPVIGSICILCYLNVRGKLTSSYGRRQSCHNIFLLSHDLFCVQSHIVWISALISVLALGFSEQRWKSECCTEFSILYF